MNVDEMMQLPLDTKQFVIDCHEVTEPGHFAFLMVAPAANGELGVIPLAYIAEKPPAEDYEVIGYIFEGTPEDYEVWFKANEEALSKLNIKTS